MQSDDSNSFEELTYPARTRGRLAVTRVGVDGRLFAAFALFAALLMCALIAVHKHSLDRPAAVPTRAHTKTASAAHDQTTQTPKPGLADFGCYQVAPRHIFCTSDDASR